MEGNMPWQQAFISLPHLSDASHDGVGEGARRLHANAIPKMFEEYSTYRREIKTETVGCVIPCPG